VINLFVHLPLASLALLFHQFPSRKLRIIGVTGTDGKTTTISLIYQILKEVGYSAAMVSSVFAKIGDEEIDTGLHVTSPDPWPLQNLLKKMVEKGVDYVVLEVTSHALDQFRVLGISFEVGVLTNVTHEHLDYHKTYENYLAVKAKLFDKAKIAVLNKDDESYKYLESRIKNHVYRIISYGIRNEANFTPQIFPFKTRLPGEYNQYNCLAAIAATSSLGISGDKIRKGIASFPGVIGRMEKIDVGQDFQVIIDFAHTPNALEQVLKTLNEEKNKKSKIIVVFGAAGLRDVTKRPIMGEIAGRLANFAVITAEDPRTENVNNICNQIAEGCKKVKGKFKIVADRQEAINFAVRLAKKDDFVVVCGKGHELSMCFGTREYPWSDQEAVKKALKKRSFS